MLPIKKMRHQNSTGGVPDVPRDVAPSDVLWTR